MFLKFFTKKSEKNNEVPSHKGRLVRGIDTEMNYCPSCGDEFRADISNCGLCNQVLISGMDKLQQVTQKEETMATRSMEIVPEDGLVNIRKGPIKDIKSLQKLLAKERIPALIAGDETSCRKGCSGPELILQIKKEDIPAATEVLARDYMKSTALDSHDLINSGDAVFDHRAAETVCPACGCKFSPTVGACPECGLCFE